MTSHRVMNSDLKISNHLPKNHKFKSVVHTIVARHRLTQLLRTRKTEGGATGTERSRDSSKEKEEVAATAAVTAIDVNVVIDNDVETRS